MKLLENVSIKLYDVKLKTNSYFYFNYKRNNNNIIYLYKSYNNDIIQLRGDNMAQINLRVDDEVKKQAEIVCNDIGISLSSAINIYLKKLGREYRIPFEVSADPFYNKNNIAYLEEKFNEFKKGNMKLVENEIIEDEN